MPIDLTNLNPLLTEAAIARELVPLVGAGVSRQSRRTDGIQFPTWPELIHHLADVSLRRQHFGKDEVIEVLDLVKAGKFLFAAQAVRDVMPVDLFADELRRLFDPEDVEPAQVHHDLFQLGSRVLLTTNYDRLLERALVDERRTPAVATYEQAPSVTKHLRSTRKRRDPLIFKMHGDITNPTQVILGEKDYRLLLMHRMGYRDVLESIFMTKTVLMIGFSGSDPEVDVLLQTLNEHLAQDRTPDFLLLPAGRKGRLEQEQLRKLFSIEIIEYEPSADHREVSELVAHLAEISRQAEASKPLQPTPAKTG